MSSMPIKKVKSKRFKSGWGFRLRIDRKDMRVSRIFETERLAKDVETAINNRALSETYDLPLANRVTVRELIAEHLEAIAQRPHLESIKVILNRFAATVGGDRPVRSLRKADLMGYVKARQREKKPPLPQTINRDMTEIKAMLNSAWKHFAELDEYQAPKVSRLSVGDVSRSATWTDEDFTALLKVLLAGAEKFEYQEIVDQRRKLAECLIVGRLTGMRPGEVRKLHRSQVDFVTGMIKITSMKGGRARRREVPMNAEVTEILKRRAALGEWIFSNPTGDNFMTEPYGLLRTACKRAGVIYGLNVPGGKIINDTRRTFENEALEAGHQPVAVAKTLGHSVQTMVKHYLRATDEQLRAVVNSSKNYSGILAVSPDLSDKSDKSDSQNPASQIESLPVNRSKKKR